MHKTQGSAFENYEATHSNYDLTRLPLGASDILKDTEDCSGLSLIDCGCGTGLHLSAFASHAQFAQLRGLDASATGVRRTQEKLRAFGHVQVQEGDICSAPFADSSFNVALYSFVLHHLRGDKASERELNTSLVLAEARRVLQPAGRIYVITCTREQMSEAGCMWYYRYFPEGAQALAERFLDLPVLKELLVKNGFRDIQTRLPEHPEWTPLSFDTEGPFQQHWRDGDSMFAYYRDKEDLLHERLQNLRAEIRSGKAQSQIEAVKQRTETIGQAVLIAARR